MKIDAAAMPPKRINLSDYKTPNFSILEAHLHFQLYETKTLINSKFLFKKLKNEALVLNGENLHLHTLSLNEKKLLIKV